jgi:hypothetical protein
MIDMIKGLFGLCLLLLWWAIILAVTLAVGLFLLFGVPAIIDPHISNKIPLLTNVQLVQKTQSALVCSILADADKNQGITIKEIQITGRDIYRWKTGLNETILDQLHVGLGWHPNLDEWAGDTPIRFFKATSSMSIEENGNARSRAVPIVGAERIIGDERKVVWIGSIEENKIYLEPNSSCIR